MQVICDPNVLVSAAVTPNGVCAQLLVGLSEAPQQLIVSPLLLAELRTVLGRPRFATPPDLVQAFERYLRLIAVEEADPAPSAGGVGSADSKDDYLIRLTLAAPRRLLVTGDRHLLDLAGPVPVATPRVLLDGLRG